MFCYIYGDYFGLYEPGALQSMIQGRMGSLGPVNQGMLLGFSVMMAVPAVMIFLSLALPPRVNRVVQIVVGLLFTLIVLATLLGGAWAFYLALSLIEVTLTLLVVWYAWSWPVRPTAS